MTSFLQNELQTINIEDLIAAPLTASIDAQGQMNYTVISFIKNVCLTKTSENEYVTNYLTFRYQNSKGLMVNMKIPIMALVNIPNLRFKKITIIFDLTIQNIEEEVQITNTESTQSLDTPWSKEYNSQENIFKGQLTSDSLHTRSSDVTSKVKVTLTAQDTGPPEGISKLLNLLESSIKTNKKNSLD